MGSENRCKRYPNKKSYEAKDKEKAYIIGGGTSVKEVLDDPLMYDDLHQHILFGCNKAVMYFDCDYFVYHDHSFANMNTELIDTFQGTAIYAPDTKNQYVKYDNVTYFPSSVNPLYSLKGGVYTGNNCGVTALGLSIALGFKEIYLLGMDCRFARDKSATHFHNEYKREPINQTEDTYDAFANFFEVIGRDIAVNKPDVKVYNCSYISLIDIDGKYFKRINLRESFDTRTGKSEIQPDVCGST